MAPVIALVVTLLAQQQVTLPAQVVTPEPQTERACITMQQVPCESVPPVTATPCTAQSLVRRIPGCPEPALRWEMRSKPLFWTGAGLVAGGAALVVGAATWGRDSETLTYPTAPCGTDPVLTRMPIAPCRLSDALLATGAAMMGGGVGLMLYGGQHVLVGADGRQITIRVKF